MSDEWIDATAEIPDDARVVIVAYRGRARGWGSGSKSIALARFAGEDWRFLHPSHKTRKPERILFWCEMPEFPDYRATPKGDTPS